MAERSNAPDIVIALSTGNEKEGNTESEKDYNKQVMRSRRKHNQRKSPAYPPVAEHSAIDDDVRRDEVADEGTDKELDASEESTRTDTKAKKKAWAPDINQQQWTENGAMVETENAAKETLDNIVDFHSDDKLKPNNLQDLVDAIGTRMRDIENVVQKMSEKVRKPENENDFSVEKRPQIEDPTTSKKNKRPETDIFRRYPKTHNSKYLHNNQELASEKSPFPDDPANLNGYFSDASNTVKMSGSKGSPAIYMAPVENRRAGIIISDASELDEPDKKHKKHHKKKKNKTKLGHHKKRHNARDEKRNKGFNKINSIEMQPGSLEDSSG